MVGKVVISYPWFVCIDCYSIFKLVDLYNCASSWYLQMICVSALPYYSSLSNRKKNEMKCYLIITDHFN